MRWLTSNIHWIIGFAGIWTAGNGILHDIAVLAQKRPFERDLIRLLVDGQLLIFSGILYLMCFKQLQQHATFALWICLANSIFLLTYCALIFKLIPSVGMIFLNVIVLIAVIAALTSEK